MKNLYSFMLVALLLTINQFSVAQVARQYVLLEQANNTSMPVCSYFIGITNDIESAVTNVTVASYHDMDYFYCGESANRLQEMYGDGDSEYPAFWVDGIRLPYLEAISDLQINVEARNTVQSNFSIELSETHNGSDYSATVVLTKEADFSNSNMVLRLIIKEKDIYYEWTGWEGETVETVDNVVRAMIPSEAGSPVDLSSQSSQTINLGFTIDPEWDKDNCEIIAYIQDTDTEEVLQAEKLSLQEINYNYDAYLSKVLAPKESVCENTISPIIVLKNKGGENLINLVINYAVGDEAPMTYNWTGNLSFNERTEINLPAYTFPDNYNTSQTISFTSSSPNGVSDENTENDVISTSFTQAMFNTSQLLLELKTDDYGDDTSWEVINSSGTVIASGDGYSNTTVYYETIDIPATDCYTFIVYDTYGDGIMAPGYYKLKDMNDKLIAENGFFNSEESTEFKIDATVGTEDIVANEISIFPNPSNGNFFIIGAENASIFIYDMMGNIVYDYQDVRSNERIGVNGLSKGSYIIKVTNNTEVISRKVVITE